MKPLSLYLVCVTLLLSAVLLSADKKKELTQVLELPKEPPTAVSVETRNLIFHVSPLSAKGLLSQQTRDAVKALLKLNAGSTIVKIRAFVAGSGDMRRVPAIVSEMLTDKKQPLPAVSVIQVGGLTVENAQVVLESIAVSKREVNPEGIAFVGGQAASSAKPLEPTLPLAEKSLNDLEVVLSGVSTEVLRVTCFTSSLDEAPRVYAIVSARFPHAAVNVVEIQRATPRSVVDCEATARLSEARKSPLEILSNGQVAAVSAAKLALTGTQLAFGFDDKDAQLAFQRLDKELEPLGTSTKQAAMVNFYPLSNSIAAQVKRVWTGFFNPQRPPATTILPFEGLPAMEASFAVDVAAVINQ